MPLEVPHGLIHEADAAWVEDGRGRSLARRQVLAVDAAQSHLALLESSGPRPAPARGAKMRPTQHPLAQGEAWACARVAWRSSRTVAAADSHVFLGEYAAVDAAYVVADLRKHSVAI